MTNYSTVSGDMWDSISFKVYGTTAYTGKLMDYNSEYLDENYIFPAGIVLRVPDADETQDVLSILPPWRR